MNEEFVTKADEETLQLPLLLKITKQWTQSKKATRLSLSLLNFKKDFVLFL